MATFHITADDDAQAIETANQIEARIRDMHGSSVHVSHSFGNGPAIIVLTLPDGVQPGQVTSLEAKQAVPDAAPVTQPVEPAPEQNGPVAEPSAPEAVRFGGEFDN